MLLIIYSVMIGLLVLGYFPYSHLAEKNEGRDPNGSREQRLLKYTLGLLFIRLLRFILRFISGFTLMMLAVVSWFRRKRVIKGKRPEPIMT